MLYVFVISVTQPCKYGGVNRFMWLPFIPHPMERPARHFRDQGGQTPLPYLPRADRSCLIPPGGRDAGRRNWTGAGRSGRPWPYRKLPIPRAQEAKAQVVVPVAGFVPVPIGTPDVPRFVVPAAATDHPVGPSLLNDSDTRRHTHVRAEIAQMPDNAGCALNGGFLVNVPALPLFHDNT